MLAVRPYRDPITDAPPDRGLRVLSAVTALPRSSSPTCPLRLQRASSPSLPWVSCSRPRTHRGGGVMTATIDPPAVRSRRPPGPWPTCYPSGQSAIAVLRLILPYSTARDTACAVAAVNADSGRQSAVLWLRTSASSHAYQPSGPPGSAGTRPRDRRPGRRGAQYRATCHSAWLVELDFVAWSMNTRGWASSLARNCGTVE